MESLAYIEVFLANQENKDFKLIERLNWNKLSSFAYINFLSIMMINLIIIDSCWARRPEIPSPETNSYSNISQTDQGQIATNSFFLALLTLDQKAMQFFP